MFPKQHHQQQQQFCQQKTKLNALRKRFDIDIRNAKCLVIDLKHVGICQIEYYGRLHNRNIRLFSTNSMNFSNSRFFTATESGRERGKHKQIVGFVMVRYSITKQIKISHEAMWITAVGYFPICQKAKKKQLKTYFYSQSYLLRDNDCFSNCQIAREHTYICYTCGVIRTHVFTPLPYRHYHKQTTQFLTHM